MISAVETEDYGPIPGVAERAPQIAVDAPATHPGSTGFGRPRRGRGRPKPAAQIVSWDGGDMAADSERGAPTRPEFKHGKICYLFVPSRDPRRSSDFYRDVFGWNIRTNDEGGTSFDDSTGKSREPGSPIGRQPVSTTSKYTSWSTTLTRSSPLSEKRVAQSTRTTSTAKPSDGPSSPTPTATGSASISNRASATDVKPDTTTPIGSSRAPTGNG